MNKPIQQDELLPGDSLADIEAEVIASDVLRVLDKLYREPAGLKCWEWSEL